MDQMAIAFEVAGINESINSEFYYTRASTY